MFPVHVYGKNVYDENDIVYDLVNKHLSEFSAADEIELQQGRKFLQFCVLLNLKLSETSLLQLYSLTLKNLLKWLLPILRRVSCL